ncbi:hypothetical protein TSAR_005852 [Trichomalopsis sarcophagae]|uniref:Pre-mRNA-splicing regulator female-lethal(2)D n=1 Tax=Trichomalopsis sarcophagae TaxID=543379 RepID=A0A232FKY9_9HYME|nr:hypothetical protein TSAR_005852 [Trichomalopsis sarcophagae]
MIMDRTGSVSTLNPKNANRQFFQWAVKWFYANATDNTSTKPDIPSIICLFQAIGFKLREFEKGDQLIPTSDPLKKENVRITLECGSSKMIAVLETDDVTCHCPDVNEAKDGSFWSVSGTAPMSSSMNNISRVEETGSNLLPDVPKDTVAVVRDVTRKLLKMINKECDHNQNTDSNTNFPEACANNTITKSSEIHHGLVRSYTDLYDSNYKSRTNARVTSNLVSARFDSTRSLIKDSAAYLSKKPKLNRQGTYELDENENDEPRPSPPKIASSPVLHQLLCTSLGQLSLQSDEELVGLADYVVKAHQILDKAVNYILKKLPPSNCSQSSIPEENEFVKPAPPPLMSSSFCVSNSPRSSAGSNSLVNRSVSSGSRSIASVQKPLARRSVAGVTNNTTSGLPPMRDRASSLSSAQRPINQQQASPKKGARSLTVPSRKRSTTSGSGASVTVQRTTPTTSRLPASKLGLVKNASSSLSAALTSKSQGNTSITAPRANLSFIKAPSTASRHSSGGTCSSANTSISKFGYSAAKKLASKEQELQEYVNQITEMKATHAPSAAALRSTLLDPAVNILIQKLRQELVTTKAKLEDTQNELSAWKFTPDSNTGKRLMAKCRLLYQENEELGRMISSGRIAKLEGELALQKSYSEEVKKSQSELDEFLQDLDEDVEGMQSTIYFLQQELRKARESVTLLQQENASLKSTTGENNLTNGLSPHTPPIKKEEPEESEPAEVKLPKTEDSDRYKGARTPPLPPESSPPSERASVDKLERIENKTHQTEHNDESSSDSAALIIKVENELLSEREEEDESRTSKRTLRTKSNNRSSGKTNGEEVITRTTRGRDRTKRDKSVPDSDDERIHKKKRRGSLLSLEYNEGEEEGLVLTNGEMLQSDPE